MTEIQKMYHDDAKGRDQSQIIRIIHNTIRPLSAKKDLADAWCTLYGEDPLVRKASLATSDQIANLPEYSKGEFSKKRKLMKMVMEKISELAKFSREKWGYEFNILVECPISSETTLGIAIETLDRQHKIHLNLYYLKKYTTQYIHHVVSHEFAHLVIYKRQQALGYSLPAHGREFNGVCSLFGIEGGPYINLEEIVV